MKSRRKLYGLLTVFVILIVVSIALKVEEHLAIDSCLDGGGCWDYRMNKCRGDEPHSQDLCDQSILNSN